METEMRSLRICVVAAVLFGVATVAMAQTASTESGIASPTAADPAVRARVMASVKATTAANRRGSQAGATPGSLIGPAIAAASSIPVTKARAPEK
jgi:hypothetical protein